MSELGRRVPPRDLSQSGRETRGDLRLIADQADAPPADVGIRMREQGFGG